MDSVLIEKMARLRGIGDAYHDYRGELQYFSDETKVGILRAMGCPVEDPAVLGAEFEAGEKSAARRLLPPMLAVNGARAEMTINIAARDFGAALVWSLSLDDGNKLEGIVWSTDCQEIWRGEVDGSWITRRHFSLPADLPPGYHELQLRLGAGAPERCLIIASPPCCYEPADIVSGRRLWGIAVQLYTVRSRENWGIGDFHDLEMLIRWAADRGAGFVGLNPLHSLAPADPDRASPYSASSRHFLNVLYIAVPSVPEFGECPGAKAHLQQPHVAEVLGALRAATLVDYRGVAALKLEVLGMLHRDFRARHLNSDGPRARSFRNFAAAGGELLQMHARFDALDCHLRAAHGSASGWMSWPSEYRDINGAAATAFAQEHPAEVEFYVYLQWIAQQQLAAAQALTRELEMPIGLYGDYAVGANPSGSETWIDRASYCMGAEIGAPPDTLALKGQGWGIPPQDPYTMLSQRLQGFIDLLRNNMRCYGALRLDHVMSLFRLWWIPGGCSPTQGAYVHYPLQQLLTVLTLESTRSRCLVVGEDLGVVPDEMRVAMPKFGLYHYKVMLFEKLEGRMRRPDEYVKRALATVTTHDMPTLRSFWEGHDIELRRRLNLYPSYEIERDVVREREQDRQLLLEALREQGLAPSQPGAPHDPFSPQLAQALHLYLARCSSILAALQIEDLLGMIDPVNVPGTDREYPNWQRKLWTDLEDIIADAGLAADLGQVNQARG